MDVPSVAEATAEIELIDGATEVAPLQGSRFFSNF